MHRRQVARGMVATCITLCAVLLITTMKLSIANPSAAADRIEQRVHALLERMTLEEKIGQMVQLNAGDGDPIAQLADKLRAGGVGSVLNQVDVAIVNELQRIAVEESRLGIPLLVGRDVIHGFKTVMPIPLGQAATWNPELVKEGARISALEAATAGINWTFAPMIDVARDARWGRIAESMGEDPYLARVYAAAMVEGYQGEDLSGTGAIAACAKHFAGYGASESGRDYATTNIPENELRNIYLPPFRTAIDAGARTLMSSFSDLDGIPATGNAFLMRDVLRGEWQFDGFVVSDWDSVRQLAVHGVAEDDRDSVRQAVTAGVNMEMAGGTYAEHLPSLVKDGVIPVEMIDEAVKNILRVKFELGLFERAYTDPAELPPIGNKKTLAVAKKLALQSAVLLKNDNAALPLSTGALDSIAIVGPLADAPYEQLGTWIFDGDVELSITPLDAIRDLIQDDVNVRYVRAMENSRSRAGAGFNDAVDAVLASDVAILFLGEESILSGEAHSRADINLPGDQAELVRRIRATGKPVIAVILAGRPLTLTNIVDDVDALLYAWHPGAMGGPAIADLLFGLESPSGKLTATFPRMVGQIPIYYNQKNTGKPPTPETTVHIDDIDTRAPQTSFGMTAFHLDAGYEPLFPFGFGLSYATFHYEDIRVSAAEIGIGDTIAISADVVNAGTVAADEVVQLYVRDLVGNVTRPVRELKGFRRLRLEPGQRMSVDFRLHTDDLAFFGRDMQLVTEPGEFHAWIGGSSNADLQTGFRIKAGP